jgi:hypothetical protein
LAAGAPSGMGAVTLLLPTTPIPVPMDVDMDHTAPWMRCIGHGRPYADMAIHAWTWRGRQAVRRRREQHWARSHARNPSIGGQPLFSSGLFAARHVVRQARLASLASSAPEGVRSSCQSNDGRPAPGSHPALLRPPDGATRRLRHAHGDALPAAGAAAGTSSLAPSILSRSLTRPPAPFHPALDASPPSLSSRFRSGPPWRGFGVPCPRLGFGRQCADRLAASTRGSVMASEEVAEVLVRLVLASLCLCRLVSAVG